MKKQIKYAEIARMLGVSRQMVHRVRYGIIPAKYGIAKTIREILEINSRMNYQKRESQKCG